MENLPIIIFYILLAIFVLAIVFTLISLPQLGDERKNLIKMKAQSSTFAVIIVYVLLEFLENIYRGYWGKGAYEGINPLNFLIVFSIMYLISLLFFKKKHGG